MYKKDHTMNFKELIKKNLIAVLAFTLVIGFSAFKAVEKSLEDTYYWFEYDPSGTTLENQTSEPSADSEPPAGCNGDQVNCAKAFTSFTMLSPGVYAPGTAALDENNQEIIRHKNNR